MHKMEYPVNRLMLFHVDLKNSHKSFLPYKKKTNTMFIYLFNDLKKKNYLIRRGFK